MLSRPSYLMPNINMGDGDGVIDASVENTFSAIIKGRAPVVAYQCGIFKNNATSDIVYDSGVVLLDNPFYGADSSGNDILFEYIIPTNDSTQASHTSIENGYIYGYKYILTVWWDVDASDYSAGCVESFETVFHAQSVPTLTINSFTDTYVDNTPVVESRGCSWTATNSLSTSVGASWFQWTLALASDYTSVIKCTGHVYSNSAIAFDYDGLTSGVFYAIRAEMQNQSGVYADSGWTVFQCQYTTVTIQSAVTASVREDDGVKVSWGSLKFIEGQPLNDNYSYVSDLPSEDHVCVQIEEGNNITFTASEHFDLDMPLDSTFVWSGYLEQDNNEIFYVSGTDDNGDAYYMRLSHTGYVAGLFPSTELSPSTTLYPNGSAGGQFTLDVNGEHSYVVATSPTRVCWYQICMRRDGLVVYESPISRSFVIEQISAES